MSPLYRGGDMLLYLWVSVCECAGGQTRHVQNVGQRHRRRANINPALVQSIKLE